MESIDHEGRTELFYAAEQDDPIRIRQCLDKGAHVNARDHHGETPLHYAARAFRLNAASLLLASGADVNAQDNQGNTPLFLAVFGAHGRGEMIRLLLTAGADKTHRNHYGISPEELAESFTKDDGAQFLK